MKRIPASVQAMREMFGQVPPGDDSHSCAKWTYSIAMLRIPRGSIFLKYYFDTGKAMVYTDDELSNACTMMLITDQIDMWRL